MGKMYCPGQGKNLAWADFEWAPTLVFRKLVGSFCRFSKFSCSSTENFSETLDSAPLVQNCCLLFSEIAMTPEALFAF